jgi:hypothetical protein
MVTRDAPARGLRRAVSFDPQRRAAAAESNLAADGHIYCTLYTVPVQRYSNSNTQQRAATRTRTVNDKTNKSGSHSLDK